RLKEHERIARTVAQLVLRQVRRDRIDPGGELLRLVEPVKVPVDPDEGLLDQILGPLTVARGAIDEVQQTRLIAVHQQRERTLLAGQERGDQTTIIVPGE